jgi:hypothetical protein
MDKPLDQIEQWLAWMHTAVNVSLLDVAIALPTVLGAHRRGLMPRLGLDDASLRRHLGWLRAKNAQACCIYARPARGHSWPVVFFDDVPTQLARSVLASHRAMVVETSPRSCHVWIACGIPLDESQRKSVQQALQSDFQADRGSVSGEHWGRLPGFKNNKPERDQCWVNLVGTKSCGLLLDPTLVLPCPPQPPARGGVVQSHTYSEAPRQRGRSSESEREWGWVMGALGSGIKPDQVFERLVERCHARRGADAMRYSQLTVRKACAKLGIPR